MPGGLEGKAAVITGGASGIGEAMVRRFVTEESRAGISGRCAGGGSIVNAAPFTSYLSIPSDVAYVTSKSGVVGQFPVEGGTVSEHPMMF